MSKTKLASIETALQDLQQGKMVVVVDDEDRENEGDLIMAAQFADAQAINFMAHQACGLICLALTGEQVGRLQLPMMTQANHSPFHTPFTVSIEAATGVTTGISAADRARTIAVASNPDAEPIDVVMPGHVFPLRAHQHGVLGRAGHTEASVDLARLAGLNPAAVICEVMNKDGSMARLPQLQQFAKQHELKIISIADLQTYRWRHECLIDEVARAQLPVAGIGVFDLLVFREKLSGQEHVAIIAGELDVEKQTLVRLHSECLTGDVFGSLRCDCGNQLRIALAKIHQEGGVLLYMAQEGRGIGLANKIKAYALQEQGFDTVEANHQLGFADDLREYAIGAQILRYLGLKSIRLLTNNPLKITGLSRCGLSVIREPLETVPVPENKAYLMTKRDKLGHLLRGEV